MATRQEDNITLEKYLSGKDAFLNTIQCNRAKKKLPRKLEKATFLSMQMTHSADWKVSTGAEGSVSSGADGATSEPSASSEGALAAAFTEPGRIHFNVLLSRLHTQWTIYEEGASGFPSDNNQWETTCAALQVVSCSVFTMCKGSDGGKDASPQELARDPHLIDNCPI